MERTRRRNRTKIALCMLAAIASGMSASTVFAQQSFRVESKIFVGDEKEPAAEGLTIFHEGLVYDFISQPNETTIFDIPRGRIILLDPSRKIRTEITTNDLATFIEQLRLRASKQNASILKFCADPKFEQGRDDDGWLTFDASQMSYRVKPTEKLDPAIVAAYSQFCDWGAKTNALTHPGGLPPFPRLAVNDALERAGCLPEQVERTMSQGPFRKPLLLRSEHVLTEGVLSEDHKKIEWVNEQLVTLRQCSPTEYLQATPAQAKR